MITDTFSLAPSNLSQLAIKPLKDTAQVVLVFASRQALENHSVIEQIKSHIGCPAVFVSTSGQINSTDVSDEKISFTYIELKRSRLKLVSKGLAYYPDQHILGQTLYTELNEPDMVSLMIFSDGTQVNGSTLKDGLESLNNGKVPITGGLAGDGALFEKTLVGVDNAEPGRVVALAFYGEHLEVGHGSRGGWTPGPDINMVSSSNGNVLKAIEGAPALDFYKKRLNGKLQEMPADALKYPLSIFDPIKGQEVVRTILSVDEESKTMTFAGDVPVLSNVRFLHATENDLIQGARSAATVSLQEDTTSPDLAILISCVGRKLVLNERTSEEVEAVQNTLGAETSITGFYSYGELSPTDTNGRCELHNQTMTITTFREIMD